MELAQTVPVGYTNILSYNQAQDVLGDGWTVDVIKHILKSSLENDIVVDSYKYNVRGLIVEQFRFAI